MESVFALPTQPSSPYQRLKAKAVLIATLFTSSGCAGSAAPESGVEPEGARVDLMIGTTDGYTIVTTTGSVEAIAAASVIHPFVDTLRVESTDTVAEPRMPICGRDTVPPVHLLVTLLPPVPSELRDGLRCTRRGVYATCQGPIPIRVERTDNYTVTGRSQEFPGNGVTVTRSSSLAYDGSGVEGQHNVRVAGSGSAQATLVLDASAGRLVSSTEEADSEIGIAASGQTRRFSQRVVRTVTRK